MYCKKASRTVSLLVKLPNDLKSIYIVLRGLLPLRENVLRQETRREIFPSPRALRIPVGSSDIDPGTGQRADGSSTCAYLIERFGNRKVGEA